MRTAAEVHARTKATLEAVMSTAHRADGQAIQRALEDLGARGLLDAPTQAFLRQAHAITLTTASALAAVLDVHDGRSHPRVLIGCNSCASHASQPCRTIGRVADVFALHRMRLLPLIDAGEAWNRGQSALRLNDPERPLLLAVEEFSEGFVIRPVDHALPPPPPVPTLATERVLIVDKRTGEITDWPLMPLTSMSVQYRRFKDGRPMIV
ncbi:hypothetical protein [Spirillospora sp. NPDC047279]|uniref:hypothetical protein n=1 Tax=Spirillospora sp. NPDC047279 TaxID=3155478 RepID=UPI0033C65E66